MTRPLQSFWGWSLEHYDKADVAPLLLRLQDEHGLNVNIVLWICWCAQNFDASCEPLIGEAINEITPWNNEVTTRLRAARRALKAEIKGPDRQFIVQLRDEVKSAELAAEKVEQSRLEALAVSRLGPATPPGGGPGVRRRALSALKVYGRAQDQSRAALLESAVELIFSP